MNVINSGLNKRGQQQLLHHKLPKYVTSIQVVTVSANFQSFLQRKFVKQSPQLFCSYTLIATYTVAENPPI